MFKCFEEGYHRKLVPIELATITLVAIVFKVWRGARVWIVHDVNVWWFIIAFVIFAIKIGMDHKKFKKEKR